MKSIQNLGQNARSSQSYETLLFTTSGGGNVERHVLHDYNLYFIVNDTYYLYAYNLRDKTVKAVVSKPVFLVACYMSYLYLGLLNTEYSDQEIPGLGIYSLRDYQMTDFFMPRIINVNLTLSKLIFTAEGEKECKLWQASLTVNQSYTPLVMNM